MHTPTPWEFDGNCGGYITQDGDKIARAYAQADAEFIVNAVNALDAVRDAVQARADGIKDWLASDAPYVSADQKHLDEHTPERAYWHYGYYAALLDIIKLQDKHR